MGLLVELELFALDGDVPVVLVDSQGHLKFASSAWLRLMEVGSGAIDQRLALSQILPTRVFEERMSIAQGVMATGTPARMLGFCAGRLMLTTMRTAFSSSNEPLVMCVLQRVSSRSRYLELARDPTTRRALANWGMCLARLKPRELQVLRMLGLGYSSAEMAHGMYRSIKTVESHRVSLGRKFPSFNRSDLVRLAIESGIVWLDNEDLDDWWSRGMVEGCRNPSGRCSLCSPSNEGTEPTHGRDPPPVLSQQLSD